MRGAAAQGLCVIVIVTLITLGASTAAVSSLGEPQPIIGRALARHDGRRKSRRGGQAGYSVAAIRASARSTRGGERHALRAITSATGGRSSEGGERGQVVHDRGGAVPKAAAAAATAKRNCDWQSQQPHPTSTSPCSPPPFSPGKLKLLLTHTMAFPFHVPLHRDCWSSAFDGHDRLAQKGTRSLSQGWPTPTPTPSFFRSQTFHCAYYRLVSRSVSQAGRQAGRQAVSQSVSHSDPPSLPPSSRREAYVLYTADTKAAQLERRRALGWNIQIPPALRTFDIRWQSPSSSFFFPYIRLSLYLSFFLAGLGSQFVLGQLFYCEPYLTSGGLRQHAAKLVQQSLDSGVRLQVESGRRRQPAVLTSCCCCWSWWKVGWRSRRLILGLGLLHLRVPWKRLASSNSSSSSNEFQLFSSSSSSSFFFFFREKKGKEKAKQKHRAPRTKAALHFNFHVFQT